MNKSFLIAGCFSITFFLNGCATTASDAPTARSVNPAYPCAVDPNAVDRSSDAFKYADVAGSDFYWVGDDDSRGLNPVRLKLGTDCKLQAKPGYDDFGSKPTITAEWRYTADGAIRIVDWSDQFSLIRTTNDAHEICWASFSTCEGEGKFRSDGGVRRLFFTKEAAQAYFDSI